MNKHIHALALALTLFSLSSALADSSLMYSSEMISQGQKILQFIHATKYIQEDGQIPPTALITPIPSQDKYKEKDNCEELEAVLNCRVENATVDISELDKIFSALSPLKQCNCLDRKIKIEFQGRETYLQELQSNMRIQLREKVSKKVNRKIINNFSAMVEDVSYYTTTLPEFFGPDAKTQEKNALKSQCAEKEGYKKALYSECGKKFEDSEVNSKLNEIFEGIASKEDPLEIKFKKLMKKIMEIDDVKTKEGKPYTRMDHDHGRATLKKTDAEFNFIDNLIQKFMVEGKFSSRGNAIRPLDFATDIIMKEARKNPEEFMAKYMDRNKMGPNLYATFKASIESGDDEKNPFFTAVSKAMGLHPGFEAMMLDSKLFDKVSRKAREPFNLSGLLEDKSSIMADYFIEKCENHMQDVAKALCYSVDELSAKMSADDLNAFIVVHQGQEDIFKQLTCNSPSKSDSFVKDLFISSPTQKGSDLTERLEKPFDKQTNPFSKFVKVMDSGNIGVKTVLKESFEQTGFARGLKSSSIASSMFGSSEDNSSILTQIGADRSKVEFASRASSSTEIPSKITDVSSQASSGSSTMASAVPGQVERNEFQPSLARPYLNPVIASTNPVAVSGQTTAKSVSSFDPKKEFREFLANEANHETVDKLLNQADDSMLKELQLMRENYARNQQKLNEMSFETEKMRLKMLEDEIKGLENKKSKIVSPVESDEETGSGSQDRKATSSAIRETKREIASLSQFADVGGAAAGSSSGQTTGPGKADLARSSGMDARAFSGSGQNDPAPVLISSQSARSSGLDVRPQDLSLEVMSYIQNSDPDVQTLLKMRTTGMLYKYQILVNGKVVEKELMIDYTSLTEDAKKLIDQKIASQGIDPSQIDQIDRKLGQLKRSYTISSLKLLLGEKMKR